MSVSVKIRNKDKLFKAIIETIPHINDNLRGAMMLGADEMVEKAKQMAPVLSGDLRKSIEWDWTAATEADKERSPALLIYAGNDHVDSDAFYASFLEHGTVNMTRRPFFFPAYRLMRKKIQSRMSRAMTAAIKNAGF